MKEIKTDKAPKAIGPYSQAIKTDSLIFVSGQLPIDPNTNEFASDEIVEQTKMSLTNLKNIIEEAGSTMDKVLKVTVYLKNMEDFPKMNEVYETFFSAPYPARAAFEVARLPKDALVEIEAVIEA